MSRPLVTAIVAVYNEARRLPECLASLQHQTYDPLETIVVDDGSTDGTGDAARAYASVRVIRQDHLGKASAVNLGAVHARGDIVLFLDGDMYFDRGYVAALVTPMIEGRARGTCHGTEIVANPNAIWSRCWQAKAGLPPDRRLRLTPDDRSAGSVVFRAVGREDFLRVGGFDDTGYTDDHTLFPKLGARAEFVCEAIAYHYNVESLAEVFAQGVWGGASIYRQWGAKALATYCPPLTFVRACVSASRLRFAAVLPYDLVFEAGVFWGVARRALGLDRTNAR